MKARGPARGRKMIRKNRHNIRKMAEITKGRSGLKKINMKYIYNKSSTDSFLPAPSNSESTLA